MWTASLARVDRKVDRDRYAKQAGNSGSPEGAERAHPHHVADHDPPAPVDPEGPETDRVPEPWPPESPAPPLRPNGRNAKGRFTAHNQIGSRFEVGNTAALTHGAKSGAFWAEVDATVAERRAEYLRDLGVAVADPPAAFPSPGARYCRPLRVR